MRNIWDVIIVGSGPAGLFCAYTIRESNEKINILVIDKGPPVDERYCDSTCQCKVCHILSGGGGAGLFSDGKLTLDPSVGFKLNYLLPSNVLNGYIKLIEDTFLRFGHQGMLYYPKNKKIFERVFRFWGFSGSCFKRKRENSQGVFRTCFLQRFC